MKPMAGGQYPELLIQQVEDPKSREQFIALLAEAGLPFSDLDQPDQHLLLFHSEGKVVGTGGFELHGEYSLIRSVSVIPEARTSGVGRSIVMKLKALAKDSGATGHYLLTTSAKDFFLRQGFQQLERDQVPEAIRRSSEFSSVCPSSAILMYCPA